MLLASRPVKLITALEPAQTATGCVATTKVGFAFPLPVNDKRGLGFVMLPEVELATVIVPF